MRTAFLSLFLAAAASLAVAADTLPKPAPSFTISRQGGPPIQLNQLKGKLVVLTFILTTCPHCQALTTALTPIAKEYSSKNVMFVECAFNQDADKLVPDFVKQFNPPFTVGWSTDPAVQAFGSAMDTKMYYVPHMVFIDANGMIRSDHPGEDKFFQNPETNVRAELDSLLKAGAATPTRPGAKGVKSTASAAKKSK